MLNLIITTKNDENLRKSMLIHYSQPKGFVGRSICYAIYWEDRYYGHIVGGSATLHLSNRNEYFGIQSKPEDLNRIVNNTFYHVELVEKYPYRNFTTLVVKEFAKRIKEDWLTKYGDELIGIETLVEKPRTGELYLRAGFEVIGETKGFTCKREGGKGSDSWGGTRVWDKINLRPKLVLVKKY